MPGTREDPWKLTTPSGGSEYNAYRAEADPPALVVRVGKTELRYHLRALEDLPRDAPRPRRLDAARQRRRAEARRRTARSRPGRGPTTTRSAAGTGSRRGCAGGSPTTSRRSSRRSGWRRGRAQGAQQPHAGRLTALPPVRPVKTGPAGRPRDPRLGIVAAPCPDVESERAS